jgi:hypothetical protein
MRILHNNYPHYRHIPLHFSPKNALLFKSRCNILIGFEIIKELPGWVGSGTSCTTTQQTIERAFVYSVYTLQNCLNSTACSVVYYTYILIHQYCAFHKRLCLHLQGRCIYMELSSAMSVHVYRSVIPPSPTRQLSPFLLLLSVQTLHTK